MYRQSYAFLALLLILPILDCAPLTAHADQSANGDTVGQTFDKALAQRADEARKEVEWSGLNSSIALGSVDGTISSINEKTMRCSIEFGKETQIGGLVIPGNSVMSLSLDKVVHPSQGLMEQARVVVYFITYQDPFGYSHFEAIGIRPEAQ